MTITIEHPYLFPEQAWYRGNLHTHTTNSDGDSSPQETIDAYAARGYHFLMLSDHDFEPDLQGLDSRGMALIPGWEVSANGPHLLAVGCSSLVEPDADRQKVIDAINAQQGASILCHPNWEEEFNHCDQQILETLNNYTGIEICNGVCLIAPGSGYALDRWDRLLGKGRKIWGFGNDDLHRQEDGVAAWNYVQAPACEPGALVEAMKHGRFYVSTGPRIDRIAVEGNTIHIASRNAGRIIAYQDFQRRFIQVDSTEVTVRLTDEFSGTYLRFECWGEKGTAAYTQPFFIHS